MLSRKKMCVCFAWSMAGLLFGSINFLLIAPAKADCIVSLAIYLDLESVSSSEPVDPAIEEAEKKKWEKEAGIYENWFSTDNFGLLISLERGQ